MANKKFKERTFVLGPSVNGVQSYSSGRQTIMGTGGVIESHDSYSHESNPGIEWAYKTFGKVYESCKEPAKRMREDYKYPAGWNLDKDDNNEDNYILSNEDMDYYDDVDDEDSAKDIINKFDDDSLTTETEKIMKSEAMENGTVQVADDYFISYDPEEKSFTAFGMGDEELSSGSFVEVFDEIVKVTDGDIYWDEADAGSGDDMDDDFFDEDYDLDD